MHRFLIANRTVRKRHGLLLGVCVVLGCAAGSDTPTLVPVTGKVDLDGTPLTGASVIFMPKDGTKGTGGFGVTDAQGRYELRHASNKVGIQPGTYRIIFSKIALKDGSPIPSDRTAADMGATEKLPPQLSSPTTDPPLHTASVSDSGGNFDFKLATK